VAGHHVDDGSERHERNGRSQQTPTAPTDVPTMITQCPSRENSDYESGQAQDEEKLERKRPGLTRWGFARHPNDCEKATSDRLSHEKKARQAKADTRHD
jgi:hypothetical protein